MEMTFLGIIFLLILVTPNIIFRKFYFNGKISSDYFDKPQALFLVYSIIPGFILHSLFILIVVYSFGRWIGFDKLIGIINSINLERPILFNKQLIWSFVWYLFSYNVLLWFFVAILGFFSFLVVRLLKLDKKFGMFRFNNKWHYIFTGEYLDFPGIKGNSKGVEFIWVDVLTRLQEETILYSGIFLDYRLEKNSFDIASVTLQRPMRRFLFNTKNVNYKKTKKTQRRDILGSQLIIPAHEILNINITYYEVEGNLDDINQEFKDLRLKKLGESFNSK